MLSTYKDLKFWQRSYEVFLLIVKLARKLPKDRTADILIRQVVRSAASVGANIAEGFGRYKGKEYPRYLQISLGSADETDHWLRLLNGIYPKFNNEISAIIMKNEESIQMLTAALSSIRRKKS